jgi:hypothetical protein
MGKRQGLDAGGRGSSTEVYESPGLRGYER